MADWLFVLMSIFISGADEAPEKCPPTSASIPKDKKLQQIITKAKRAGVALHSPNIPPWLKAHTGSGNNSISEVVLERARKSYLESKSKNSCYLAMDATKAHATSEEQPDGNGSSNNRGYLICEAQQIFLPFTSGHGSGTKVGSLDMSNPRECATNFGSTSGSSLTAGGSFMTGKLHNSYKGEFVTPDGKSQPACRKFLDFNGTGDNENARTRDLGLHAAYTPDSKGCYKENKDSKERTYYFENWNYYYDGRSNGCMSTTNDISDTVVSLAENNPMSVYIYPEEKDVQAIREVLTAGKSPDQGTYWDDHCLKQMITANKFPRYWNREFDSILKKARDEDRIKNPKPEKVRTMCKDDYPSQEKPSEETPAPDTVIKK